MFHTTSDSKITNIDAEPQASTQESKKFRTVLKPLSKDQQKALLKAKSEKEQNEKLKQEKLMNTNTEKIFFKIFGSCEVNENWIKSLGVRSVIGERKRT